MLSESDLPTSESDSYSGLPFKVYSVATFSL